MGGEADALASPQKRNYLPPLTKVLRGPPAENFGSFAAAILIAAPVLGLRPFLAFLFDTLNVPNPTNVILSPFLRVLPMVPRILSRTFVTSFFAISVSFTTFSMNSCLLMVPPVIRRLMAFLVSTRIPFPFAR